MIRPRLHYRICPLIALAAMWGSSSVLRAEQPPAMTPAPAESKTAQPPAKPQIIYRVPRGDTYADTLHSQSKSQSHPAPSAANEPAPPAEQSAPENKPKNATTPRQQKVKRPKMQSVRPKVQGHGPSKARGPGKSHGKSGKK